jgi:hypothetical protein
MINFIDDNVFFLLCFMFLMLFYYSKIILGPYIVMIPMFQNGTRSKTAYGCGFHLLGLLWAHQFYFLFQVMIRLR